MHSESDEVTIAEFTEELWEQFCKVRQMGSDGTGQFTFGFEVAQRHGWVSPELACRSSALICRNEASRIVHEFLRRELGEPDEENWDEAKTLKDLYDCRTCVAHVAQVVCKGIMTASDGVFGMRRKVTWAEARLIAQRCVDSALRVRMDGRKGASDGNAASVDGGKSLDHEGDARADGMQPVRVTKAMARELMENCGELTCIDVRTPWEYDQGSQEGFVNYALLSLMEDPASICPDKSKPILLGCDVGYRSEIAANFLSEAGYQRIYYFGWE